MPLNLYRRHFRAAGKCAAGYPPDFRNYESDELRRSWKKCHCPIYADGTLGGRFKRQNTRESTWTSAKLVTATWEVAGKWNAGLSAPEPSLVRAAVTPEKTAITIQFAIDAYLANREGRNIAPSTLRKYKTFVRQLHTFANWLGYVDLDQFGPVEMDRFYVSWRDGIRAKAKKLARLKVFLRFCVKRKWIVESPVSDLEAPIGAGRAANRMPLTDLELTRVYDTCDRLPQVQGENHMGSGSWGGDDVKTMVMLLCWTGLRRNRRPDRGRRQK